MLKLLLWGVGIAVVAVMLTFLYVWWRLTTAKHRMINDWLTAFDCSRKDAEAEAECVIAAIKKRYGLWHAISILDGKAEMNQDFQTCLENRCLRKCRDKPLSGSVIDSDIKCT